MKAYFRALAVLALPAVPGHAQTARPQFEVSSVKLNTTGCAQGRGGDGGPSPGSLPVTSIAIRDLIQAAYGTFANGPMLQKLLE